jgi:hypothetical protein
VIKKVGFSDLMDFFKAFPLLLWKQAIQQFKEKPPRFFLVKEFGGMLLKHKILQKCSVFPKFLASFVIF